MSRPAFTSALALLLLAGCGMYGDLYLEDETRRMPEVIEAPPIAIDGPAPGLKEDGTPARADDNRADDEREDSKREDDTAGSS